MQSIKEKLNKKKVLLSDGAWGTNLQRKGLKTGECPEKLNIEQPGIVKEVAQDFIDAGAELVKTNTFGGTRFKLEPYGLAGQLHEVNRKGAAISKEAAGDSTIVMASIGPTGKMLITGEVTEEDLYEAFKEQAIALEEGGADVILVETMSDLDEARIAVKAAKENTACEIACTMTFEKTVDNEYKSMMGVGPLQMFPVLPEAGADIIGANCGNGIEGMIDIVKEIRSHDGDIPVIIHANAGMPIYEDGKTVFPETPDEMARQVEKLIEAGANIIGGCCGTTPEHIKKMRAAIDLVL